MRSPLAGAKISLALGPGHHGDRLIRALAAHGAVDRVIRYWPSLQVEDWEGARPRRVTEVRAYRACTTMTWALWRRLPYVGEMESPRGPLSALYDRLAQRQLRPCDLFVGWTQMCLHSLRRARQLGALTVLEHPMSHVDTWMPLAQEEYARFGRQRIGGFSLFPKGLVARMRAECDAADRISVLSSYARRTFLDAGVAPERLIQVPMGVDPRRFRPGPARRGPFRVLYVGRLELLKGVQHLLSAFTRLGRSDAELWLVGPLLPELRPLLQRLPGARIRLCGEVAKDRLPAYYRLADALVLPTINDAFGLVLLEAMASGLPIIATERSAGPDLIEEGRSGFVVPIRDSDAIADRLARLMDDRALARSLGERGRALVLERYTWEDYAARITAAYGALLSGPRGAAPGGRAQEGLEPTTVQL